MVMEGDSCYKGCELEFRHCIMDGHFSHTDLCKICNVCLKRRN